MNIRVFIASMACLSAMFVSSAESQVAPNTSFQFSSALTLLGRLPNGSEADPVMPKTGKAIAVLDCRIAFDGIEAACLATVNIAFASFVYLPRNSGDLMFISGLPPIDPLVYGYLQNMGVNNFRGFTTDSPMQIGLDSSPEMNNPLNCTPAAACTGGSLWYVTASTDYPQDRATNCTYARNTSEHNLQCVIGTGDLSAPGVPYINIQAAGSIVTSVTALSAWICANPATIKPLYERKFPTGLCPVH